MREEKADLISELSEGYKVRKKEDKEISLEWDTTSGDGIDKKRLKERIGTIPEAILKDIEKAVKIHIELK